MENNQTTIYDESEFTPPSFLTKEGDDETTRSHFFLWNGAWDEAGVYVYQAFNDDIANYALQHQKFEGCPDWRPDRGTWIKPSLAWMLYRSGYGSKPNQNRILQIHLSHRTIAQILEKCKVVDTNRETRGGGGGSGGKKNSGGNNCRIQWDPERDLNSVEKGGRVVPRRMISQRAIQICISGQMSRYYALNILSITDVTDLAHRIGTAHKQKKDRDFQASMEALEIDLPDERPYFPRLLKN